MKHHRKFTEVTVSSHSTDWQEATDPQHRLTGSYRPTARTNRKLQTHSTDWQEATDTQHRLTRSNWPTAQTDRKLQTHSTDWQEQGLAGIIQACGLQGQNLCHHVKKTKKESKKMKCNEMKLFILFLGSPTLVKPAWPCAVHWLSVNWIAFGRVLRLFPIQMLKRLKWIRLCRTHL